MSELVILRLIRRHLPRVLLAGLVSVAAELAGIGLISTAAWLLARAAQQPPLTALTIAIVAVRALAIGRGLFRYLERLTGHDAVLRALAELRGRVYSALAPLAPGGLRSIRGGDLLTRFVADVDAVQDLLLRCAMPAFTGLVVSAAVLAFVGAVSPLAGLVLLVGMAIAGLALPWAAGLLARRSAIRTAAARAELSTSTVDLVRGAADLAAYGAADRAVADAGDVARRLAAAERRGSAVTAAVGALGLAVQGASVLGVAVAVLATLDGSPIMVAVCALTSLAAFEVLLPLPAAARRLQEVRASAARLAEVLEAEVPVADPASPAEPPEAPVDVRLEGVRPEIPARGRPDAEGRLPAERQAPAERHAPPGVDLHLTPGRRVAVVGPSGAGKSMLLAALVRFVPLASGSITVNGVPVEDLRGDDVRALVSGALTGAHVFHATLTENLLIARPGASSRDVADALEAAGLGEWVASLPDGLSTVVGEDGDRMSGGQRQRLILARALLAAPPVLLLDEPTEGLDPETADAVLADLLDATRGRTVLLVTHRLRGLEDVDEIVVIEAGEVTERGTHASLVEARGYYAELWASQALAEGRYAGMRST